MINKEYRVECDKCGETKIFDYDVIGIDAILARSGWKSIYDFAGRGSMIVLCKTCLVRYERLVEVLSDLTEKWLVDGPVLGRLEFMVGQHPFDLMLPVWGKSVFGTMNDISSRLELFHKVMKDEVR